MLTPLSSSSASSRLLIGGTAGLVLVAAALAHVPSLWSAFVGVSLAATAGLVALWRRDVLSMREVLVGAIVFRAAFVPLDPLFSDDVFRYLWDGWLQWEGINPYRYVPSDPALVSFQDDPLFDRLNSPEYFSVYPPLSQLAFLPGALAFQWGGGAWGYFVTKAVFLSAEIGGLLILTQLAAPRQVLLYAWNPLVLLEMAGQVHTEALLIPCLLGTVWAVRTGRGGWASVCLAGATFVKLIPIVLGPYLIRRFGWRAVWPGALVAGAVSLPYAAPYVLPHIHTSVDLYVRLFEFNAGLYQGLKQILWAWTGADWSKTLGPALRWTFAGLLPFLYAWDVRRSPSFESMAHATLGLYLALSTTVHPWYLLAVLPLAVLHRPPRWAVLWLGAFSLGTYLFYQGAPMAPWTVLGWAGAAGLVAWQTRDDLRAAFDRLLQGVQTSRARAKATRVQRLWTEAESAPPETLLDLGAGEGYVGRALRDATGASVVLADVVDMNRTSLPHHVYDGQTLSFATDAFDTVVLYFVLHHCEQPDAVLREALRVARRDVVVVESVYRTPLQRRLLHVLDPLANRLRSGGLMTPQEEHLTFRRAKAWQARAESMGARVLQLDEHGSWIHPQATLHLRPRTSPEAVAT